MRKVATILAALCLCAQLSAEPKAPVKVRYEIDLWREYGKNEAKADLKYTGKTVEMLVRGDVRKGADGAYMIGSHYFDPPKKGQTYAVRCHVRKADVKKLADAEMGDAFRIRGVCKGRFAEGAAPDGYYVRLDACEVLSLCVWKKDHYEDKK